MLIETRSGPFRKSHPNTIATDTSFPSKIPKFAKPTGEGVIDLVGDGSIVANGLFIVPYGTGSDNDTFDMRVIGWRLIGQPNGTTGVWIPNVLAQFACTISSSVGLAGGSLLSTERICDTISLTIGNANISNEIVSFQATVPELPAHIVMDAKGSQLVEFTFDLASGTGAACLVAFL